VAAQLQGLPQAATFGIDQVMDQLTSGGTGGS
jgi:hypothetical protein